MDDDEIMNLQLMYLIGYSEQVNFILFPIVYSWLLDLSLISYFCHLDLASDAVASLLSVRS